MKYKFVKKFSGMVLYVLHRYPDITPGLWRYRWEKATDTEAYKVMCLINKDKE
jgi:hypothetical protein